MFSTIFKKRPFSLKFIWMVLCFPAAAAAQQNEGYRMPPKEISNIIENAVSRKVVFSPNGELMAILERPSYIGIQELSRPYLSLGGLKIDPESYGNREKAQYSSLKIKDIPGVQEFQLSGLPKDAGIADVSFSPDGRKIAFSVHTHQQVQLWLGDIFTRSAARLTPFLLNDTYGRLYQWAPSGEALLARFIPDLQKKPSADGSIPQSPVIMENQGEISATAPYPDLLNSVEEEQLFDHYLNAQLKMVYLNGQAVNFNRVSIYKDFDFSPDGQMVMIKTIEKPYSYAVSLDRFPFQTTILDKYGKLVKKLAETPLADRLPQGMDAVINGPREHQWRADKAQTFIWVEAQDQGNPAIRQLIRDVIYMQDLQNNKTTTLAQCYLRFHHIDWGDDQIAIVTERWFKTRSERRVFIKPANPSYRVNLWDRYYEDAYSDPGEFVKIKNQYNREVLLLEYNPFKRFTDPNNIHIFSIAEGASASGNRPFLLQFNVKTKLTDTLFRSQAPFYEKPVYFSNKGEAIISRESVIEPPNYFLTDLSSRRSQQLTYFPNPYPELFTVIKKQVDYSRKPDNLHLSGTLYLPKNYNVSQGRLPVLIWVDTREYKTSRAAAEVQGSPYQFPRLSWNSPVFWVTQGYAVLDHAQMPVVGESNEHPNDSYLTQARANARAAIDKLTAMGIADPKRIAIGGQGSGAEMTASLLANTDFFAAGIGRNGIYNKTLTPFGFPGEERSYWDKPELYLQLSPFFSANQIKTPLLLIQGLKDEPGGISYLQGQHFYHALKGFGATTRLVLLPGEDETIRARESVLHMLYEMDSWLKKHVKTGISVANLSNNKNLSN